MRGLKRMAELSQEIGKGYSKLNVFYSIQKDHVCSWQKDETYYRMTYLIRPCTEQEIKKAVERILSL